MSLKVDNLSFSYADKKILDEISFEINPGDFVCLLGRNGVGKSTLFKLLLGFLHKASGQILIDGKPLEHFSRKELARKIAYIPQYTTSAFNYTVFDTVLMGTTCRLETLGSPKAKEKKIAFDALKQFEIEHLAHKNSDAISGGERQLVILARAVAQGSKILILDEPTANLDYGNQVRVMKTISKLKEMGYAIILSTHNPEQAMWFSDKVMLLDDKKVLAFGNTQEVISEELLKKIYSIDIDLIEKDGKTLCVPRIEE
ncbi:MAG: ABC transporter ATP-binding protein [Pleomorphochaeta sp.]